VPRRIILKKISAFATSFPEPAAIMAIATTSPPSFYILLNPVSVLFINIK